MLYEDDLYGRDEEDTRSLPERIRVYFSIRPVRA
jgi:hypothetical protein